VAEPGAPSRYELRTRDHDGSLGFLEVFRWETHAVSDGPEQRYAVLVDGGERLAGVADATLLPPGGPAASTVYFGVDDTDAAVAQAVELGGAVLEAAKDAPYGRIAALADPNGARFSVVAARTSSREELAQAWVTLPALMQDVQTLRRFGVLPTSARTRWMLGFQRRGVRRWEWDTDMPKPGPLPQTSQLAATRTLSRDTWNSRSSGRSAPSGAGRG
jgi:predicted enzyme related to lactoylglutathione lyase